MGSAHSWHIIISFNPPSFSSLVQGSSSFLQRGQESKKIANLQIKIQDQKVDVLHIYYLAKKITFGTLLALNNRLTRNPNLRPTYVGYEKSLFHLLRNILARPRMMPGRKREKEEFLLPLLCKVARTFPSSRVGAADGRIPAAKGANRRKKFAGFLGKKCLAQNLSVFFALPTFECFCDHLLLMTIYSMIIVFVICCTV